MWEGPSIWCWERSQTDTICYLQSELQSQRSFLLPESIALLLPLRVPLWVLPFSLARIYVAFRVPPLILIFPLPHSIPIAFVTSPFLFLCFLVTSLLLQHFYVISLSFLLFSCPVIVSFSLPALCVSLTHKETSEILSEISEVREDA